MVSPHGASGENSAACRPLCRACPRSGFSSCFTQLRQAMPCQGSRLVWDKRGSSFPGRKCELDACNLDISAGAIRPWMRTYLHYPAAPFSAQIG